MAVAERVLVREGRQYSFSTDSKVIQEVSKSHRIHSWSFDKDETPAADSIACVVGIDGRYRYYEIPKKDLDTVLEEKYGIDIAVLTAILSYPEIDENIFSLLL